VLIGKRLKYFLFATLLNPESNDRSGIAPREFLIDGPLLFQKDRHRSENSCSAQ
jgi:hypothetical protein